MDPIVTPVLIFGEERYSFLDVVNHYNSVKVGYDGSILRADKTAYVVPLPPGGTVPVRNMKPLAEMERSLQRGPGVPEAMGIEFCIPVRRGYKVRYNARLTSWDDVETLASFGGEAFYKDENNMSESVLPLNADNDPYGYVKIVLDSAGNGDLQNPNTFLQNKIRKWLDMGLPATNRLFVLRVRQLVCEADKNFDTVRTDFEGRDDSLILEFTD